MSETKITEIGNSGICIDFMVNAGEVNKSIRDARVIVEQLEKRPLGEKQLGKNAEQTKKDAILKRATRFIVEKAIRNAVEENGIRLVSNPKLELETVVVENEPYCFSITLDTVPRYKISNYENLEVPVENVSIVTDKDIDARLEEIRERSVNVEKDSKNAISENDIVELSFTSYIDGEEYDGNVVESYTYTLGSLHLPKAFEDGLKGLKAKDKKTIEFDIPSDFSNQDIAGKSARFDVEIKRVATCTYPEINDKFAADFGYKDLHAWREKIKNELKIQKENDYQDACEKAARASLANCMEGKPDKSLIDAHTQKMLQAFKTDLKNQGTTFEEYCRFLNISEKDVIEEMSAESSTLLRENLALESLFRTQNMKITNNELKKTIQFLAQENGMPTEVSFKDFNQEQKIAVREMTMHRMATEWLLNNVRFV